MWLSLVHGCVFVHIPRPNHLIPFQVLNRVATVYNLCVTQGLHNSAGDSRRLSVSVELCKCTVETVPGRFGPALFRP